MRELALKWTATAPFEQTNDFVKFVLEQSTLTIAVDLSLEQIYFTAVVPD